MAMIFRLDLVEPLVRRGLSLSVETFNGVMPYRLLRFDKDRANICGMLAVHELMLSSGVYDAADGPSSRTPWISTSGQVAATLMLRSPALFDSIHTHVFPDLYR